MASSFGIAAGDLHPDPIPDSDFTLLADTVDVPTAIASAEQLFISWCGGLFTTAANIALARPQVLVVVVWYLHYRKAQVEYKVPEDVKLAKKSAEAWATSTGQSLLSAEGTVQQPGAASVQHGATTARFTRSKMDLL